MTKAAIYLRSASTRGQNVTQTDQRATGALLGIMETVATAATRKARPDRHPNRHPDRRSDENGGPSR